MLTACQDQSLQIQAHTDFDHQSVIDFFARVEGNVQRGEFLQRVWNESWEIFTLEVRQIGKTKFDEFMFGEIVNTSWGDFCAEIDVESIKQLAVLKLLKAIISDGMFIVIRWKLLELKSLLLKELDDCKLLNTFAQRYIDSLKLSTRDSKFYENLIGDRHSSEVDFLDLRCKISDFVDQIIGDVVLILNIQVFQLLIHDLK